MQPIYLLATRTSYLIDPTIGLFGYDRKISLKEIKDGISTTMMTAETKLDNGPWTAEGFPTLRGLNLDGSPYLGTNGQFGGTHRGGGMVLFVDGSVKFISDRVQPTVFEAWATIAGGEEIEPAR